jgi:hypothetical protein
MTIKIVTGPKTRFSYLHVFKPQAAAEGQTSKYSVSLIIPKSDEKTLAKVKKGIEQAYKDGLDCLKGGNKTAPKLSAIKIPLRDGDEDRPDDPAYKDSYFINANSTRKPGIVDRDLTEIIDPAEIYSGCYGRASINLYAYNVNGNRGIAAGLNNLQKLADGDPLGGMASRPEDDFADLDDEEFEADDDDVIADMLI